MTNLRIAPHLVHTRTSHSPVNIAHHGPVNILVSQRPMASNRPQISTINHSSRAGQHSGKNTITPSSMANKNQILAKSRGATLNDISRSSLAQSNALSPAFDDNSMKKARIPAYQETVPLSSSNRALLDKIMSQRKSMQSSNKPQRKKKTLSRKSKSQPYLSSHPSSHHVSQSQIYNPFKDQKSSNSTIPPYLRPAPSRSHRQFLEDRKPITRIQENQDMPLSPPESLKARLAVANELERSLDRQKHRTRSVMQTGDFNREKNSVSSSRLQRKVQTISKSNSASSLRGATASHRVSSKIGHEAANRYLQSQHSPLRSRKVDSTRKSRLSQS